MIHSHEQLGQALFGLMLAFVTSQLGDSKKTVDNLHCPKYELNYN